VSPKKVVVAGRVAVSEDEADAGAAVCVDEVAGVCARTAVERKKQTAAKVEERRAVVIKAVPPGVPAKLSHNSTAELYSKSINDLRD
jgi:predicted Zn-dependent protease